MLRLLPFWSQLWKKLRCSCYRCTGWPKKLHIPICFMLNWYSFVKSQPNFILFLADLHLNRFPTKQCMYCPQHLLHVSTLSCRNNIVRFLCNLLMNYVGEQLNSVNRTKLYWSVYINLTSSKWKCAVFSVTLYIAYLWKRSHNQRRISVLNTVLWRKEGCSICLLLHGLSAVRYWRHAAELLNQ